MTTVPSVRELPALRLPGARILRLCEVGTRGAPVVALYLHGTGSSRLEIGPYAVAAEEIGVRIVAWDRPGHGGSPKQLGRSLLDVTGDAATVADAVGSDRPAVIGLSGGGSHVLALAATAPEIVRRAIAINPGPPADDDAMALLPRSAAKPIRLARDNPRLFGMLAGAMQHSNPLTQAVRWRRLHDIDREVIREAPTGPLLAAAAEEGARQKGAWLAEARMLWGAPWGFALDHFQVPLDVFLGEDDPYAAFARSLATSGAMLHEFPGGHMSGFVPDVMKQIVALAAD